MGDKTGIKTLGPYGGKEGESWKYEPQGPISKIIVYYDKNLIRGIKFQSKTSAGKTEEKPFGETEKGKTPSGNKILVKEVCIDNSKERLESVGVAFDFYLRALTFYTQDLKGRPGKQSLIVTTRFEDTTDASLEMEGGDIVGFHGRYITAGPGSKACKHWINAIGVHVKPAKPLPPPPPPPPPPTGLLGRGTAAARNAIAGGLEWASRKLRGFA